METYCGGVGGGGGKEPPKEGYGIEFTGGGGGGIMNSVSGGGGGGGGKHKSVKAEDGVGSVIGVFCGKSGGGGGTVSLEAGRGGGGGVSSQKLRGCDIAETGVAEGVVVFIPTHLGTEGGGTAIPRPGL